MDDKTEQNVKLFEQQKKLLDTFLKNGAISRAQYDKSLGCLVDKLLPKDKK